MQVLLIEDDEMYAELVTLALKRAGIGVRLARNAIVGLQVADEMVPDAIVVDVALPQMNGIEAVTRIRDNEKLADVPIIVATASGTMQSRYDAEQAGADMFLEKPFALSELIAALQSFSE